MNTGDCGFNPLCVASEVINSTPGAIGTAATNSAVERLAQAVGEAVASALASLATAWIEMPTPSLTALTRAGGAPFTSAPSGAVAWVQNHLWYVTGAIAVIALIIGAIRLVLSDRGGAEGRELGQGVVRFMAFSILGIGVFATLATATDELAAWIVSESLADTTAGMGERLGTIFEPVIASAGFNGAAAALPAVVVVVGGIVLLLVTFAQVILLVLRGGMLIVMAGMLPTVAAASLTKTGQSWLQRYVSWALALILYKPVAAIIYAVAFFLLAGEDQTANMDPIIQVVTGLGLLFLAVAALPALMKLIAPAVSAVASGGGLGMGAGLAAAIPMGAMALSHLGGGGVGSGSSGNVSESSSTTNVAPSKSDAGSGESPDGPVGGQDKPPPAGSDSPAGGSPNPAAGSGPEAQGDAVSRSGGNPYLAAASVAATTVQAAKGAAEDSTNEATGS